MAKLFLKNAYEFENPARRIFLEGGNFFGGEGAKAKETKRWVNEQGESSAEAKALAERVAQQAEDIRTSTKKETLQLYVDVFTDVVGPQDAYDMAGVVEIDSTYSKNGLLQVLEKNSPLITRAFTDFPDLRLLAYATVYKEFKGQGGDANFLPIGATVTLTDGVVTVNYKEDGIDKTFTSPLFPWETAKEAQTKYAALMAEEAVAKRAEVERRGEDAIDLDDDGVIDVPAVPGLDPEVQEPDSAEDAPVEAEADAAEEEPEEETAPETELSRDEALKAEWPKVRGRIEGLASSFPGVTITFKDASDDKKEDKPADEADMFTNYSKGKTVSIKYGPRETDVKRYQIIVPKEATSYLDASVTIKEDARKGLGVTWESVERQPTENLYDYFAGEIDEAIKENILDKIKVKDLARLNELSPAAQLYYLEWYVEHTLSLAKKSPDDLSKAEQKELAEFYKKGVEMEVSEKWFVELNQKLASAEASTQTRLDKIELNIRALQKLRAERAEPVAPAAPAASNETGAKKAAEALGIAPAVTPELIKNAPGTFLRNAWAHTDGFVDEYKPEDASLAPYLTVNSRNIGTPLSDGSAAWRMQLTTAAGDKIYIGENTPAVDPAKVTAFVEAQAALGKTYLPEEVTLYAGYLQIMNAWEEALDEAKAEHKLDEKYREYIATEPVAPAEVAASEPIPEADVAARRERDALENRNTFSIPITPAGAELMKEWGLKIQTNRIYINGVEQPGNFGEDTTILSIDAAFGRMYVTETNVDGSSSFYTGSSPEELFSNIIYVGTQIYLEKNRATLTASELREYNASLRSLEKAYPRFKFLPQYSAETSVAAAPSGEIDFELDADDDPIPVETVLPPNNPEWIEDIINEPTEPDSIPNFDESGLKIVDVPTPNRRAFHKYDLSKSFTLSTLASTASFVYEGTPRGWLPTRLTFTTPSAEIIQSISQKYLRPNWADGLSQDQKTPVTINVIALARCEAVLSIINSAEARLKATYAQEESFQETVYDAEKALLTNECTKFKTALQPYLK
ncbi:MAG: hypothetical protein AAB383_03625 [Patescibacteria group bacterium]